MLIIYKKNDDTVEVNTVRAVGTMDADTTVVTGSKIYSDKMEVTRDSPGMIEAEVEGEGLDIWKAAGTMDSTGIGTMDADSTVVTNGKRSPDTMEVTCDSSGTIEAGAEAEGLDTWKAAGIGTINSTDSSSILVQQYNLHRHGLAEGSIGY